MNLPTRFITLILLGIQSWVAVSGTSGGIGCLRFWACLAPDGAKENGCECCRQQSEPASPKPATQTTDHDDACCISLPYAAPVSQKHDASIELDNLLSFVIVFGFVSDCSWMIEVDVGPPTRSPPPDPERRLTTTGLRTTRLLI